MSKKAQRKGMKYALVVLPTLTQFQIATRSESSAHQGLKWQRSIFYRPLKKRYPISSLIP